MERMEPHELAELIRGTLEEGRPFCLKATGISMFPTLRPERDAVELVSPSRRSVRRGEIVLFARLGRPPERTYVLHRVRKVLSDGRLVMNGDSQQWCEEIGPGQVIGVAEAIVRDGRRVPCDGWGYRLYCGLWSLNRPFRLWMGRLYGMIFHGTGRE